MSLKLPTPAQARAEAIRRIKAKKGNKGAGEGLSLDNLGLRELPPEIGWLSGLFDLQLDNNDLTALPEEIERLQQLRALSISRNRLSELPGILGAIPSLRSLNASNNDLETIPDSICDLKQLETLHLHQNKLAALPEPIHRMRGLTTLKLYFNRLGELPAKIAACAKLRWLDVDDNRLEHLPEGLGQLRHLETLRAANNRLKAIPPDLSRSTSLKEFDLSGNSLRSLPRQLDKIKTLKHLYLHGNPSLGLPENVLGPTATERSRDGSSAMTTPADILDFYRQVQGESGRALRECKLIVVGRGGAGKTSLIRRLQGMPYNPEEKETHGITIDRIAFPTFSGEVTARVWDFGGQVVLHSMHEFFLTAGSLYLLVLNERDDNLERDATYWLQLIRSYAGDAPVVIALNKSGGRQRQFDGAGLEKSFGSIFGSVPTECSAADDGASGIESLRAKLTAVIESPQLHSVRGKCPPEWLAIKDELDAIENPYLNEVEFRARCRAHGVKTRIEQNRLTSFLHSLGVALNYDRARRLRNTSVLKPDWLANGIYAVLRANDLDRSLPAESNRRLVPDARLTVETMAPILRKAAAWKMLDEADYPREKREFLLELMGEFHLSYPLGDDATTSLVPTLLPSNPPDGADEPSGPNRIRLRYEFKVVPAPLIPWFIARTFSLIPDGLQWRRGAVLELGAARAKVWTSVDDETRVFVAVAGPLEARDELARIIRGSFRQLFAEYRGIAVTEQYEYDGEMIPRAFLEKQGLLAVDPADRWEEEKYEKTREEAPR